MSSRNFAFTQNNYSDTVLVDNLECKYIVYGREVGESGTPHLQGHVCFQNAHSLKSIIKKMPGCHVEVARCAFKSVAYCKKGGDFTERGDPPLSPVESAKKGVAERWELAKQGRFEELPPEQIKTYEYIKRKFTEVSDNDEMDNEWRYGKSGAGKSRSVRADFPVFYTKDATKWWDGYDHEPVVVLDDWDPKTSEYLTRYLKIWSDHYEFKAEVKGGSMQARPKKFIITSQYTIGECFPNPEDFDAISRRFKCHHYAKL